MSKIIRILGNEDNIDFNEIISFTTERYVGLSYKPVKPLASAMGI